MEIREVPRDSQPRERLVKFGAQSLATHELLAILLRTGIAQYNVMSVAQQLLLQFEDLYALRFASLEELEALKGIGRVKAIELQAVFELAARIAEAKQVKLGQVTSSESAGRLLQAELAHVSQEHVVVLFLNTRHELIRKKTIFTGSLNASVAHPREIFREAVRISAARLIVGHNHPSGNPTPSQADITFTKRLQECGDLIGIELLDHIIVGSDGIISMREEGYVS